MEQLSDELAGQGLDQTDHGITQRHFPHVLLKPPLSNTFSTKIALLPAVDAATTEALPPFTKSAEPLRVANVRAEHSWLLRLLTRSSVKFLLARLASRLVVPLSESPATPLYSMSSWHGLSSNPPLPPLVPAGRKLAVAQRWGRRRWLWGRGLWGGHGGGTGGRRREAGSDSDDSDTSTAPADTAAAASAASGLSPRRRSLLSESTAPRATARGTRRRPPPPPSLPLSQAPPERRRRVLRPGSCPLHD